MTGAEELAAAFRQAAEAHPRDEANFRRAAEAALERIARAHGVTLVPQVEVTLATGRADAVFNRMIIEWEPPLAMSGAPGHRGNLHAVQQVQNYVDGLAERERRKLDRLSGVACDGHWMIFCRYRAGRWVVDDPVPVDERSADQLLRSLIAAQTGRALTADNLLRDFSDQANLTRQMVRALVDQLDAQIGQDPDGLPARLYRQWERFFAIATGVTGEGKPLDAKGRSALARVVGRRRDLDAARALFCLQTYFAVVTKLIASLSLSFFVEEAEWELDEIAVGGDEDLLEDMEYLQRGEPFARVGLRNVLEPDVFGWFLVEWQQPVREGVRQMIDRLKEYDPATLQVSPEDTRDLLKDLYQGLLPRPLRHALGQYFTPDWLASMLLDRLAYHGEPEVRVVDPACGTGTFLALAINRLLGTMRRANRPDGEILAAILHNVVGFDIDPLATLAARTNYVLALGPLIRISPDEGVDLPVYRADSMVGPTLKELQVGDRYVLETEAGDFSLPACVDTAEELRAVCDLAVRGLDEQWDGERYASQAGPLCAADASARAVLAEFFDRCRAVHHAGIDGLWPRLLRNAFMPAFIGRFHLVAGNPPWVNWEHLPGSYREHSRTAWQESGLFVHGGMATMLGAGKKDVSMLMSYVVTDRLLEPRGHLGFVVPETLFKTAGAGQGFRTFKIGRAGPPVRVEQVDDMVDLNPFTGAANRTALVIWQRDVATRYPVVFRKWQRLEPRGIRDHAIPEEVEEQTRVLPLVAAPVAEADRTSAWLTAPNELIGPLRKLAEVGEPTYHAHEGVNSGGANGVYWVAVDGPPDRNARLPVTNLHDIGDREVPKKYGRVEETLVHPLIRGRDVQRWHARPSAHILFVQDPETRRGIPPEVMAQDFVGALAFLSEFEEILRSRAAYRRYFARGAGGGAPFWSMFNVGTYTLARHKVLWKDQTEDFAAAVVSAVDADRMPLPNHKAIMLECESDEEAHYVCAALNSTPTRAFIAAYAIGTAISTHPLKYVHVPRFDSGNRKHQALVAASRSAHAAASASEPADQAEVDRTAAALWGLKLDEVQKMGDFLAQLLKRDLKAE